jgi:hypothetical protein
MLRTTYSPQRAGSLPLLHSFLFVPRIRFGNPARWLARPFYSTGLRPRIVAANLNETGSPANPARISVLTKGKVSNEKGHYL